MESIKEFTPFVQGYILTVVAIIGLVIGSFLNVVALRLLSGESIVFPCSKCPKCKTPLKWYDNIPVLAYLLLRGKCRYCKEKISIQYPVVEAFAGLIFLGIFMMSGFSLQTLFLWVLSSFLIVMTVTDIREKLVYDVTSFPIIPLGLLYNFFDIGNSGLGKTIIPLEGIGASITLNEAFISAVIASIAGAAFFEIISRITIPFVGERAFGEGDTIIAAGLGAWFGLPLTIVIIILSFLFQLIIGLPVILYNMYKDKDYKSLAATAILIFSVAIPYIGQFLGVTDNIWGALATTAVSFIFAGIGVYVILSKAKERQSFTFLPFGPALVFGGFIVMFWGNEILNKYNIGF